MLKTKSKNVAFTITAKNRLPSAMICRDTFVRYNPGVEFFTFFADLVTDKEDVQLLLDAGPIIGCHELKSMSRFKTSNKLEEMAYKYDVVEFCTAVKPFIIEYLMWCGYDKVLFFDPDICFFDSVGQLYEILETYQCILTPHILSPMPPDGKHQTDVEILSCGVYNLGFGGWSLSQDVIDFMGWWQTQLQSYCYHDVQHHMFVDQYWMDFAPAFLKTFIVKHPGYNTAYWNLHERQLAFKNNKWTVNDRPLVFYHYSGLDYCNPKVISIHQNRFNLDNRPELSKLFFNYMKQLYTYDALELIKLPYYFNTSKDTPLDDNRKHNYTDVFQRTANPWVADNISDRFGINIIGYFPYVSGVADVARHFVKKIYSTGIPYTICPVVTTKPALQPDEHYEYALYYANHPSHDTSIFFVNLDQIKLVQEIQPNLRKKRNIGIFWWEIEDDLPFQENLSCVDEIICFTKFTYDIFKKFASSKEIHKLPYPFVNPKQGMFNDNVAYCKERLGLSPDDFVFYTNFDYASSYERKNPMATLEAFAWAHKGKPKVKLLVKTLNSALYPAESRAFELTCKSLGIDNQVTLIQNHISVIDLQAMMNMCDVYVSLHRSEGCGLSVLEALYFGKPVIATGYGGNMEFMNENNSLVVEYEKIKIDRNIFTVYREGGTWAEPSINDAANKMQSIVRDKSLYKKVSEKARQSVIDYADMHKFNEEFYNLLIGA
jgi:glycosyltransferase involved in cell wall biosynthesis